VLWIVIFALGALAAGLKSRFDLLGASVVALALFLFLLPLIFDLVPDIIGLPVALALLAVPSIALFTEPLDGSIWQRISADRKLGFAGQVVGVLLMLALMIGMAVAFAAEGIVGGAVTMVIFTAAVAYAFVPGVIAESRKLS